MQAQYRIVHRIGDLIRAYKPINSVFGADVVNKYLIVPGWPACTFNVTFVIVKHHLIGGVSSTSLD